MYLLALLAASALAVSWVLVPRLPQVDVRLVVPAVETVGLPTHAQLVIRSGPHRVPRHHLTAYSSGDRLTATGGGHLVGAYAVVDADGTGGDPGARDRAAPADPRAARPVRDAPPDGLPVRPGTPRPRAVPRRAAHRRRGRRPGGGAVVGARGRGRRRPGDHRAVRPGRALLACLVARRRHGRALAHDSAPRRAGGRRPGEPRAHGARRGGGARRLERGGGCGRRACGRRRPRRCAVRCRGAPGLLPRRRAAGRARGRRPAALDRRRRAGRRRARHPRGGDGPRRRRWPAARRARHRRHADRVARRGREPRGGGRRPHGRRAVGVHAAGAPARRPHAVAAVRDPRRPGRRRARPRGRRRADRGSRVRVAVGHGGGLGRRPPASGDAGRHDGAHHRLDGRGRRRGSPGVRGSRRRAAARPVSRPCSAASPPRS